MEQNIAERPFSQEQQSNQLDTWHYGRVGNSGIHFQQDPSQNWYPREGEGWSGTHMPYDYVNRGGDYLRKDKSQLSVCRDFLRGRCPRGASCRYWHSEYDKHDGSKFYGNDQLNYLHTEDTRHARPRPMFDWSTQEHKGIPTTSNNPIFGESNKKNDLRTGSFSREPRSRSPCRNFLRGRCYLGASCAYFHPVTKHDGLGYDWSTDQHQGNTATSSNPSFGEQNIDLTLGTSQEHGEVKSRGKKLCKDIHTGSYFPINNAVCERNKAWPSKDAMHSAFNRENISLTSRRRPPGDFGGANLGRDVCLHFSRGRCNFGESCKFLHGGGHEYSRSISDGSYQYVSAMMSQDHDRNGGHRCESSREAVARNNDSVGGNKDVNLRSRPFKSQRSRSRSPFSPRDDFGSRKLRRCDSRVNLPVGRHYNVASCRDSYRGSYSYDGPRDHMKNQHKTKVVATSLNRSSHEVNKDSNLMVPQSNREVMSRGMKLEQCADGNLDSSTSVLHNKSDYDLAKNVVNLEVMKSDYRYDELVIDRISTETSEGKNALNPEVLVSNSTSSCEKHHIFTVNTDIGVLNKDDNYEVNVSSSKEGNAKTGEMNQSSKTSSRKRKRKRRSSKCCIATEVSEGGNDMNGEVRESDFQDDEKLVVDSIAVETPKEKFAANPEVVVSNSTSSCEKHDISTVDTNICVLNKDDNDEVNVNLSKEGNGKTDGMNQASKTSSHNTRRKRLTSKGCFAIETSRGENAMDPEVMKSDYQDEEELVVDSIALETSEGENAINPEFVVSHSTGSCEKHHIYTVDTNMSVLSIDDYDEVNVNLSKDENVKTEEINQASKTSSRKRRRKRRTSESCIAIEASEGENVVNPEVMESDYQDDEKLVIDNIATETSDGKNAINSEVVVSNCTSSCHHVSTVDTNISVLNKDDNDEVNVNLSKDENVKTEEINQALKISSRKKRRKRNTSKYCIAIETSGGENAVNPKAMQTDYQDDKELVKDSIAIETSEGKNAINPEVMVSNSNSSCGKHHISTVNINMSVLNKDDKNEVNVNLSKDRNAESDEMNPLLISSYRKRRRKERTSKCCVEPMKEEVNDLSTLPSGSVVETSLSHPDIPSISGISDDVEKSAPGKSSAENVLKTGHLGQKIEQENAIMANKIQSSVEPELAIKEGCTSLVGNTNSHSMQTSQSSSKSAVPISRRKLLVLDLNGLLVDVVGGDPRKYKPDTWVSKKPVFKRPFCDDFLQFCFERFDVGVWSSRVEKNVNTVVDFLMGDSKKRLLFCWDQSHCTDTGYKTIENNNKPLVLKELKKLWEKHETSLPWDKGFYNQTNTVLLDDSPYKALRNPPYTAIFPHPYSFKDAEDKSLGSGGDLRVYLERLEAADNVQDFIQQNPFGQPHITNSHLHWAFYEIVFKNNKEKKKKIKKKKKKK